MVLPVILYLTQNMSVFGIPQNFLKRNKGSAFYIRAWWWL